MRFSVVAFTALAVFGDNLGAYARAVPNSLALRGVSAPVPVVPKLPTIEPGETVSAPKTPEVVAPEVVAPEVVAPEVVAPEVNAPEVKPIDESAPKDSNENDPTPKNVEEFKPEQATVKADEAGVKEDPSAVSDDNVCGIVAARSLDKRARVPDDAADWRKVYLWLTKESGVDRSKMVFYSGNKEVDAKNFVKQNPKFAYFHSIFDEDFMEDFGGLGELDAEIVAACSKAMGMAAEKGYVFGHEASAEDSMWRTIEYPATYRAQALYSMKDGALSVSDKKGSITIPDRPGAGGGC